DELEDRRETGPAQRPELRERDAAGHGDEHGEDERRRERRGEDDHRVAEAGDGAAWKIGQRPYRRSRRAYDARAWSRCSTPKSGHSTSVAHISAYATSQSRKFETRSSPPVRMSRSGSGWSGA